MREEASLDGLRLNSDIAAIKPFGDAGVGDEGAAAAAAARADEDAGGRSRVPVPPPPPPPPPPSAGVATDAAGLRDSLRWVRWGCRRNSLVVRSFGRCCYHWAAWFVQQVVSVVATDVAGLWDSR